MDLRQVTGQLKCSEQGVFRKSSERHKVLLQTGVADLKMEEKTAT